MSNKYFNTEQLLKYKLSIKTTQELVKMRQIEYDLALGTIENIAAPFIEKSILNIIDFENILHDLRDRMKVILRIEDELFKRLPIMDDSENSFSEIGEIDPTSRYQWGL